MKLTSCLDAFETTVKLKKLTSLPVKLLEKFIERDIAEIYSENNDALILRILYLEKIGHHYNSKIVITKMRKHI